MDETTNSRIKSKLRELWLRSRERGAVLKREKYTCEKCGVKQSRKKGFEQKVEVHHKEGILNWDKIYEVIREQLEIDRWVLFGGSWGSTLSLVYAQTHSDRVLGLIVRGIFLTRQKEIDWFYQEGASRIFPDYWQDFINPIAEDERDNLLHAYYKKLTGEDEIAQMQAAKAWSIWEGRTATLKANKNVIDHFGSAHTALSLARIECHYFMHDSFLEENQILNNADKLQNIPGVIVQGRYDLICPLESAWELHQAWSKAELKIIADAGHSATETGIIDALITATDKMAKTLI